MVTDVMKRAALEAIWPVIVVQDGRAIVNVDFIPDQLRKARPTRESVNLTADALEYCINEINELRKSNEEFNRAVQFALTLGSDAHPFLATWNEGDWKGCAEWGFIYPEPAIDPEKDRIATEVMRKNGLVE
jgi:hypothetical protein